MKSDSFIGVMVLGVLLVVFAGVSHAGGMMHRSSGETKSTEQSRSAEDPKFWTYEYWQASETGMFPSHEAANRPSDSRVAPAPGGDAEPKQQIGAFEYRDIDLGP
jgi:hypothetical protein